MLKDLVFHRNAHLIVMKGGKKKLWWDLFCINSPVQSLLHYFEIIYCIVFQTSVQVRTAVHM